MLFPSVLLLLCAVLSFVCSSCNTSCSKKRPRNTVNKEICVEKRYTRSMRGGSGLSSDTGDAAHDTSLRIEALHEEHMGQVECTRPLFNYMSHCVRENKARDRSPRALMNMFPSCSEIHDERFTRLRSRIKCAKPGEFGSCLDELDRHSIPAQWGECFLVDALAFERHSHYAILSTKCRFTCEESHVKVLEWLICRMDVMTVEAMFRKQPELLNLKLFGSDRTILYQMAELKDFRGFEFALEVGNYSYDQLKEAFLLALACNNHVMVQAFFKADAISATLKYDIYCDFLCESKLTPENMELLYSCFQTSPPPGKKNNRELPRTGTEDVDELATLKDRAQRKKLLASLLRMRPKLTADMQERISSRYAILEDEITKSHERNMEEMDIAIKAVPEENEPRRQRLQKEKWKMERKLVRDQWALSSKEKSELRESDELISAAMWIQRRLFREI